MVNTSSRNWPVRGMSWRSRSQHSRDLDHWGWSWGFSAFAVGAAVGAGAGAAVGSGAGAAVGSGTGAAVGAGAGGSVGAGVGGAVGSGAGGAVGSGAGGSVGSGAGGSVGSGAGVSVAGGSSPSARTRVTGMESSTSTANRRASSRFIPFTSLVTKIGNSATYTDYTYIISLRLCQPGLRPPILPLIVPGVSGMIGVVSKRKGAL